MGDFARWIPRPVRAFLRRLVDVVTRGMRRRIELLEHQTASLRARVFELTPDHLGPSADGEAEVTAFLAGHGLAADQVNLNVSKHDTMYQVLLRLQGTPDAAYLSYLQGGLGMMQAVDRVVRGHLGGWDKVGSVLDFASGYGRLTRYLCTRFDPARIWVSDIKPRAVEFQRRQFGVNGFVSTTEPEALDVGRQFDLIVVISLFTHLPEPTFARWLRMLCQLCRPGGRVIFSASDVGSLPTNERRLSPHFVFSAVNEEVELPANDRPLDTHEYGLTYVSEAYVRRLVESLPLKDKQIVRLDRAILDQQDLYIISGGGRDALDQDPPLAA